MTTHCSGGIAFCAHPGSGSTGYGDDFSAYGDWPHTEMFVPDISVDHFPPPQIMSNTLPCGTLYGSPQPTSTSTIGWHSDHFAAPAQHHVQDLLLDFRNLTHAAALSFSLSGTQILPAGSHAASMNHDPWNPHLQSTTSVSMRYQAPFQSWMGSYAVTPELGQGDHASCREFFPPFQTGLSTAPFGGFDADTTPGSFFPYFSPVEWQENAHRTATFNSFLEQMEGTLPGVIVDSPLKPRDIGSPEFTLEKIRAFDISLQPAVELTEALATDAEGLDDRTDIPSKTIPRARSTNGLIAKVGKRGYGSVPGRNGQNRKCFIVKVPDDGKWESCANAADAARKQDLNVATVRRGLYDADMKNAGERYSIYRTLSRPNVVIQREFTGKINQTIANKGAKARRPRRGMLPVWRVARKEVQCTQ